MIPNRIGAKIAIIYWDGNINESIAYQSFLQANGFSVNMIHNSSITGSTLSGYKEFIIAPNNLMYYNYWLNMSSVIAINNTAARIISLGNDGIWFFERLHLIIGRPYSATFSPINSSTILPNFTANYHFPYIIPVGDRQLYSSNTYASAIYNHTSLPSNVTRLASVVGDPAYYPVIQETSRYILWGFWGIPQKMTWLGQRMFIDLVSDAIPRSNLTIMHPADVQFERGTTGHQISWKLTDNDTAGAICTIYRNGTSITTTPWIPGDIINSSLDSLTVGTYNYTIVAIDGLGQVVSDTVLVFVIPPPNYFIFYILIAIIVAIIFIVIIAIIASKKKKKKRPAK